MSNAVPPNAYAVAAQFRAAILRRERDAAVQLVRAYGGAYSRLRGDIDALLKAIGELEQPTVAQIERLSLYRSLQAQIEREVGKVGADAARALDTQALGAIRAGLADSERMVALAGARARWQSLAPAQVETALGFLQDGSPLLGKLRGLGKDVAAATADALRNAIILGYNPRKTARIIRNATGRGLSWALTTTRTAQLNAYREASRLNYLANSRVVSSWIWHAALDARTCVSCISKHGQEFPLEKRLNDHHRGRCVAIPKVKPIAGLNLKTAKVADGATWFRQQDAGTQRAMLGDAMYQAWKDGRFDFRSLSVPYTDEVYGEMLRAASLKDLLGGQAREYYANRGG